MEVGSVSEESALLWRLYRLRSVAIRRESCGDTTVLTQSRTSLTVELPSRLWISHCSSAERPDWAMQHVKEEVTPYDDVIVLMKLLFPLLCRQTIGVGRAKANNESD